MKLTVSLIALLATTAAILFFGQEVTQQNEDYTQEWKEWKAKFAPQGFNSEESYRYYTFVENLKKAKQIHEEDSDIVLKLNQFGHLSSEEFEALHLLKPRARRDPSIATFQATNQEDLPDYINWMEKGGVCETQNQGQCGSCWAFASIGALQGLRFATEGTLELLSAQQLTSCIDQSVTDDGTDGCGGSEAHYAYDLISETGIETWEDYPYTNAAGAPAAPCEYDETKVVFKNGGVGYVAQDVQAMKEALQKQPLSIAVNASAFVFGQYSDGIIKNFCPSEPLNHAILLIGYDLTGDIPYWIVQNSWGSTWGQDGIAYIKIEDGDGLCGINTQVDYPTPVDNDEIDA